MAEQWVVTCRWNDGDINYRTKHSSEKAARKFAEQANQGPHCSLEHVAEKLEATDG